MKDYKQNYGSLVLGEFQNTVAINASGPGAQDGTPFTADFITDLWGARQDLLAAAGMIPDGITESAGTSQFMEALRPGAGLPPGMLVQGFFSPARMALMRLLPLEGQLVPVAAYGKLVDAVWQGASLNPTVPCLYRCDSPSGTRNAAGDWLYLPDVRGLFFRAAGANSIRVGANNAPYDGGAVGGFQADKLKAHTHPGLYFGNNGPNGVSKGTDYLPNVSAAINTYGDNETAPASISALYCISY
jgi:hypothetical protein